MHNLKATDIQTSYHGFFLRCRNLNRVIQSEFFTEAWEHADEKQKLAIAEHVVNPRANNVKKWILSVLQGGLNQYTLKILRRLASHHRVKDYCNMTKLQLLDALTAKGITDGGKNCS